MFSTQFNKKIVHILWLAAAYIIQLMLAPVVFATPLTCDNQGHATIIGTEVAATHCVPEVMTDDTPITYQYRDFECVNGKVTLKSIGNTVKISPNDVMNHNLGIQYRTFRNKQGSYFLVVPEAYIGLIDGKSMSSFPVGYVYTNVFTKILDPQPTRPNCKGGDLNHGSNERCSLSTINSGTGRLSHSQDLFNTNSAQPLSLNASLNYRSIGYQTSAIGGGWSLNYETYLQDNGASGATLWEDGLRRIYTLYDNVYNPPRGDYSSLVKNPDGSYTITEKDGLKKQFSSTGAVTSIQDRNNNTLNFSYTAGRLSSVTDANGRSMSLDYDADSKLSTITDPRGKVYTLTYTSGKLTSVLLPDATQWNYSYDTNGLMTTKTMPSGDIISYTYSNAQKILSAENLLKGRFEIAYSNGPAEDGYVPDCYNYYIILDDIVGFTSQYTELNGGIWSYGYDTLLGVVRRITDPLGNITSYNYDEQVNLLDVTEPGNNGTSTTTSYTYDAQGNALTATDPLGQVTNFTYNSLGQVLTVSGAPGNYSYSYDTKGNLLTSSNPAGATTQYGYDLKGNLTSITNAKNQTTTLGYDSSNNLTSITQAGNNTLQFSYDANGNLLTFTDAANNLYRFSYDAMNHLSSITDPLDNITSYSYDNTGNPRTITDANGKVTNYTYNFKGQLLQIKDALNNITALNYGGSGCPACTGADKLTSITDAKNQSTNFTYDILGRTLSEIDPLGKAISYGYDKIRKPASRIDARNNTTSYSYDVLKRLIKKNYPDTTSQTYSYDSKNNITTATNKDVSYSYTYDAAGRMIKATDSRGYTLDYEYDPLGFRTATTLQKGTPEEHITSYSYDTLNRLKTITSKSGVFIYDYDSQNRRITTTYPNQITTNYSYDAASRLTGINHTAGTTTIAFVDYSAIDKAGNRKIKTTPSGTVTYHYDDIYRLTKAETPQGNENYNYDPVGNRLSGPGPKDSKYNYNAANQMIVGKVFGHDYDNNGNQTGRTTANQSKSWNYIWDYENQLIRSEQSKGQEKRTVAFKYDPFGRRIEKSLTTIIKGVTKTSTWQYVYDNDAIALEIYTDDTGIAEKSFYTHGIAIDEHLALERNNTSYFYHADGLGSITAITDSNKTVVQSYEYDSFGNPKQTTGFRNAYQYTGREWDKETGLYYYRARYYDPMEGLFISKDPIGFAGGDVNLYRYVQNNPVNWIDPTGLDRYLNCEDYSPIGKKICKVLDDAACKAAPTACCSPVKAGCMGSFDHTDPYFEWKEYDCEMENNKCILGCGGKPNNIRPPLNPYPEGYIPPNSGQVKR